MYIMGPGDRKGKVLLDSTIGRGMLRCSLKKFRFVLFVVLLLVGIALLVSCSWNKSEEGSGSTPAVYTRPASSIQTDRAVLNGTLNPDGSAADVWFEYGTDPALPAWIATPRQGKQPVTTPLPYKESIRGLSPFTTCYYRAVAGSRFGTQRGDIQSFPTGEYYVAVGNSITLGEGGRGYETSLRVLLGNSKGFPITVANWGADSATSAAGTRLISFTLSSVPWAK